MKFSAGKRTFLLNGRPVFVYSGEIHYFRVAARDWARHLKSLKAAGCNTVSTYICWDWHEYRPGKFDFTGRTHPNRNIIGFLELCRQTGLFCIVKPGPYILAEYDGNGIPRHLMEQRKDILAVNEKGRIISPDIISLMNPDYLAETDRWYDQIMPIIRRFQLSAGGPVVMMQVCNEVGLQHWLSAQADTSPTVLGLYRKWLETRFSKVADYNGITGGKFRRFSDVMPPSGEVRDLKHFAAYQQWHGFWRHYFSLYLRTLVGKIRRYGIDLQLSHNVAGWIYGGASEVPLVLSFYNDVVRECPEITFGLDHIPEYVSFRNAHCGQALNQALVAVQGGGPVWAAEFQSGTREHHVRNDARDMDLFYKASLAHGMVGWNFYMFSQGENPPGRGAFGRTFYWQTPLDVRGKPSPLYGVVKSLGGFLKKHGTDLLDTDIRAEIAVGFYAPYFYTELTTSQIMAKKLLDAGRIGLRYDPRFVRETLWFDGLLRCLQALNINYRIINLQTATIEEMKKYKQVSVVTTEYMDADTQTKLGRLVREGGRLLVYPCMPRMDCRMKPCTMLQKSLGVRVEKKASSNKISILGIDDLFTASSVKEIYRGTGARTIAKTVHGDPCGIDKKVGEGTVTLIGAAILYNQDEQLKLFDKLAARVGIRRDVEVDDMDVQAVLRRGRGYGYLFLLNYHGDEKHARVTIPAKVLREMGVRRPFSLNIRLPGISGKIVRVS